MSYRLELVSFCIALLAASACSLLTDATLTTARVEVDSTPIRTIQSRAADGSWLEPEATTLRLDEIECLRATPACSVTEAITATIHNTGDDRLDWHYGCDFPLEEFGLGAWYASPMPCLSIYVPPLEIRPGEQHTITLGMRGRHAGEYRVSVNLRDAAGTPLPESGRISTPFQYQPLPDRAPFACPTVSEVERARRLAREALERAARDERTFGDNHILRLENAVLGFGGYFLENTAVAGEQRMVVWVTEEARFEAAIAAVRATTGTRLSVVARKSRFPFSEIMGWREVVVSYVSVLPGYHSNDAHEGSNRVSVGMANPLYLTEVECIARGIGMPAGILQVNIGRDVVVID